MNKSATNGLTAAANGIALAPNELSITAPPINPPTAFAILKAEMFAVAPSSGAAFPYFMTPHLHRRHIGEGCDSEGEGGGQERLCERCDESDDDQGHDHRGRPQDKRETQVRVGGAAAERVARPRPTMTKTQVRCEALKPAMRSATGAM
jgi:hypothetical protein